MFEVQEAKLHALKKIKETDSIERKQQITQLYYLLVEEIENGESPDNELALFYTSINDLE